MICPVCESGNTYLWQNISQNANILHIRKCSSCSSLFQFPAVKNEEILYQKEYYEGGTDYIYYDERKSYDASKIVYLSRLKTIRKYKKFGRFLDVGCSFGGFTYTSAKYFESYGIDVSEFAVKKGAEWLKSLASQKKFKGISKGSLTKLPLKKDFKRESFDVISMIEVAEHLKRPLNDFQAAYKLLKKDGILIIQTANFEGWQAINEGKNYHYFLPGHFVYYTASALKKMLKNIGFRKFKEFIPVDFSLWAKLRKSKKSFNSLFSYLKWISISYYHIKSYFRKKGRPLTSSYVLYAFK